MIKVSILVPIYNVAKYIERCAFSLMEQTYKNIEYIFVDDCTPDNSIILLKNIIEKYPKRLDNIQIIHHNVNRGLAAARNTALSLATGDYILHVDSDDWIALNSVDLLVCRAIETNADIIDGTYIDIYKNNSRTNYPFKSDRIKYIRLMLSGLGVIPNQIWGRLIRRDLYIKNNIQAIDNVNYGEDYSVILRLLYYGKRSYINDVIYYYNHLNENSYMSNLTQANYNSLIKAKSIISDFYLSVYNSKIFYFEIVLGLINLYKMGKILDLDTNEINDILKGIKKNNILSLLYKSINHNFLSFSRVLLFYINYKEKKCLK